MRRLYPLAAIVSLISSSALAQATGCTTDDPNCQGYTTFGPASVERCISVRGQNTTNFCQSPGDTQRMFVHAGDQYCESPGTDPVPDECDLYWINVTEPGAP
jgi:hypothetical protein